MNIRIHGELGNILSFIEKTNNEGIISFTEENVVYVNHKHDNEIILVIEKPKIDITEMLKERSLKEIEISNNIFNFNYEEIKLKDIISKNEELLFHEDSYMDGIELVILTSKDKKIRKKVVNIILNLVKGNLKKVGVGIFNQGRDYVYRVRNVEKKGYLYLIDKLSDCGVKGFYKYRDGMYIQIGYKLINGTSLNINLFKDDMTKFITPSSCPNVFLKDFNEDNLFPLVDTLTFNFKLEKTTDIHAMEYELENIKRIEVDLSLKKTGYKEIDNLESKIRYHREEMNRLEQIQILKGDREISNQIVVIKYSQREKIGKLLSVMSSELISNIKITTVELGDSLDEKYYILLLEGYHLKSDIPEKIYCEESSLSNYGMSIYLENDKFLFPFYAMEKESGELSKEEYHKLIFGNIKNSLVNIEELKKEEKLIVIFDSSEEIFKSKNMIFIKEKDFSKNVIEIYNKKLITDSQELERMKKNYEVKFKENSEIIEKLEEEVKDIMERSLIESGKQLDALSEEWNKTESILQNLKNEIIDKSEDKKNKLQGVLKRVKEINDVEKVVELFKSLYEKIVIGGIKQINKKHNLLKEESEIYKVWRNDWSELEDSFEKTKKLYIKTTDEKVVKFEKNRKDVEDLIKRNKELVKKFNDDIEALNRKYEEFISKYE